jgi:hypothetical protein
MHATRQPVGSPIRVGNIWVFPDGKQLPVVSGGATETINPAVADYVHERAELLKKIEVLTANIKEREKAATEEKPYTPSEDDLDPIKKAQARVRKLDELINVLGEDVTMSDEVEAKLRRTGRGRNTTCPRYRSAGHVMSDFMKATFSQHPNDPEVRDAKVRWDAVIKTADNEAGGDEDARFDPVAHSRAAEHMGTTAADTVATAGGFGGLFVSPVLGPIINVLPVGQPFLTAVGKQQAPNSMSFLRPSVSDPDFDTAASAQGLQKNELRSKKFDVTTATLEMDTYGGYLNVSQQLISLHPSGWDLILSQLRARVARRGELAALAHLALSSGSVTLSATGNSQAVWEALVAAAGDVWTATNLPPEWIAYGPGGWERLAKVVDTTGRPLFPALGPLNAFGQARLGDEDVDLSGLRPIATRGLSGSEIWMGNSLTFEAFSYSFPVLEAVEPSVFGRQVAVAEALAFYRPVANGAVKIAP